MAVTLFTVACGYIGARALPEILLNPDWIVTLDAVQAGLLRHHRVFAFLHVSIIPRLYRSQRLFALQCKSMLRTSTGR